MLAANISFKVSLCAFAFLICTKIYLNMSENISGFSKFNTLLSQQNLFISCVSTLFLLFGPPPSKKFNLEPNKETISLTLQKTIAFTIK